MAPRTPLLHPESYFSARAPSLARGLAAAAVVIVGSLGLLYGVGAAITARVDGTVTVDNPNRPPEAFCDGGSTFGNASAFNCSAPPTVERNVDPLIMDAVGEFYAPLLLGLPLVLLVVAALFHAGTAAAGGEGSFGRTVSVTAWAFVPPFVTAALAVVALWFLLEPATVSGSAASGTLQRAVTAGIERWTPVALGLNLLGSAWGVVVCTFGLERARSVSRAAALTIAAVAFGGLFLTSLA